VGEKKARPFGEESDPKNQSSQLNKKKRKRRDSRTSEKIKNATTQTIGGKRGQDGRVRPRGGGSAKEIKTTTNRQKGGVPQNKKGMRPKNQPRRDTGGKNDPAQAFKEETLGRKKKIS